MSDCAALALGMVCLHYGPQGADSSIGLTDGEKHGIVKSERYCFAKCKFSEIQGRAFVRLHAGTVPSAGWQLLSFGTLLERLFVE